MKIGSFDILATYTNEIILECFYTYIKKDQRHFVRKIEEIMFSTLGTMPTNSMESVCGLHRSLYRTGTVMSNSITMQSNSTSVEFRHQK